MNYNKIYNKIGNFPREYLHNITRKVLIRFNKPQLFSINFYFRKKELLRREKRF